jgi:hypothetical protein
MRFSFSQWENYDGCPARWHFKSVLKYPTKPAGPAAERGTDLHDRCEKFILSQCTEFELQYGDQRQRFGDKRPAVILDKYMDVLHQFKDHPNGNRYVEKEYTFDENWYLCVPKTPEVKVVTILDAIRSGGAWEGKHKGEDEGKVFIGEWKSGSPKPTHADQRKLYALVGLTAFICEEVNVTTYYLEQDNIPPQRLVAKPSAKEKLQALWQKRFDQMERDKICAPRPGDYCRWCDFSRRVGGPCKVA